MKRILSLLLALATVMSLAACGKDSGSKSGSTGSDVPVNAEGKPILTIGIGNSTKVLDYENNYFTNYMEEYLDCEIQFVFFSNEAGERKRQLSTMVAAKETLPDILYNFSFNNDEIYIYGEDGYFMDLAPYFDDPDWELAKKYGWHEKIIEYSGEETRQRALTVARTSEGKMYYWPSACPSDTDRTVAMPFINKNWLDKLGLEMPTTVDELKTVLRAFLTQDPNGNGIADEIPMIGSTVLYCADAPLWYLNNFGEYINDMYFFTYDENGKIQVPYITENYRNGLKELRELVDEKLLASLTWTIKEKAELASLWTPAEGDTTVGVIFGYPTSFCTSGDEDCMQYVALPPLEGAYVPVRAKSVGKSNYITTDCKNFDLAAEFLMAFCDIDVAHACRRGEEGVDFVMAPDLTTGELMVDGINDVFNQPTDKTWASNGPYVGWYGAGSPWSSGNYTVDESEETPAGYRGGMLGQIQNANLPVADTVNPEKKFFDAIYSTEEVEENGNRIPEIKTYMKEARAKFATGMWDINDDAQWQSYLDTLDKMGLQMVIENTQAAVDRQSK